MTERRHLVVVSQPYVPQYRVALFDEIRDRLDESGIDLLVLAGDPSGQQAARGDAARPPWRRDIRSRSIALGKRRLEWRSIPHALSPTVLVSELEALNTLAWRTVAARRKLVLWGHGKPYVNDAGALADRVEWALARRADAVMTYAEGGRQYLIEQGGLPPEKVVAIGNSTDSRALRGELLAITGRRAAELRAKWTDAPRALFVGGLDESKRVEFLVDAAISARRLEPDFTLVVAGRGERSTELRRGGNAIVHIEGARGRDLAELAYVAQAIWMPGRIGLVAVDALAVGLPVLTTDYAWHAPEAEFLRGDEVRRLSNEPDGFARQALQVMSQVRSRGRALRSDIPSVQSVAENFVGVVRSVLSA